MANDRYYLIAALPTLGELGSVPPIRPAELLDLIAHSPGPVALVEALFLFDDLLQREAFLAGEIEGVHPVVLTRSQVRNESPLPQYLAGSAPGPIGMRQVDSLWDGCFRYAAEVAAKQRSTFLAEWVGYEVTLRNGLASARAQRLGLDASDYLVATDLATSDEDLAGVLHEWLAAPTPLAGWRVLLQARWGWLAAHDAWFTFRADELAAYAAKLMLLLAWRRPSEGKPKG